jgi:hypothetical protein
LFYFGEFVIIQKEKENRIRACPALSGAAGV